MSDTPIADYALLSDCNSAALVSRAGSIDWLCFPRFDAQAVFAGILGEDAGHWSIRPSTQGEVTRRYRERTMVLETVFRTPTGRATLVDAMATGPNAGGHELGKAADHTLVRVVRCDDGEVEMDLDFAPRTEYGLVYPVITLQEDGVRARGGADVLALSTRIELESEEGSRARGRFALGKGELAAFALQRRASWEEEPRFFDPGEIERLLDETTRAWTDWSKSHQTYDGPWRELVYHSGSVLQALTYQPTGAIVAAPTTSLPEEIGGVRNWDYRYAWVRDASFTMEALWVAACRDEALEFFSWMASAAASQIRRGQDLQIMFGVGGERDLTERELAHLDGWRDSRPVRIGNGAWNQRQIDVYGELMGAAHRLREQLGDIDETTRAFLRDVADTAATRWTEKDQGIWEVRDEPRHFVYSKLMCWHALDRAIDMAELLDAGDRVEDWSRRRDEIRDAILEKGWSEEAGAFTQYFGGTTLDASNLVMPVVGFLPATDPRMRATIDATRERLTDGNGLVYRYLAEDGLPGGEGTFLLCTFWLAQAEALAGETARAREVFERAIAYVNDVGLL
ncbi:MAG: glycoside hydrolase family 15 protein, partial [Actinomycetota bacterium]|nr:glycoside hydrolase family 15 protein [Actinomycetota bacterium]